MKKMPMAPINGILLIDKPEERTSHDVVAKIRGHFRLPKVGHGGTLDPMATGLLPILIGKGTKLSQRIMDSNKVYEGTMRLGISTDSHDRDGAMLAEKDPSHVTQEQLEKEMLKWVGDIKQMPPMVSAIKKDGVPLYKLARKGKTVEREPRLIHIYSFKLLSLALPHADFRLVCTKGTYVRTLCSDLGDALGCGAHLCELRRTQTGHFNVEDAIPLDRLLKMKAEEVNQQIIPIPQVVAIMEKEG